jgi:ubiquitin
VGAAGDYLDAIAHLSIKGDRARYQLRQRSKTQIFEELPSQESAGFNLNGCFPQGFKCRNLRAQTESG